MKARSIWTIVGSAVLIVGVVGVIGLYYYADRLVEQRLRPATIELLERRFNSRVELESLRVVLRPSLSIRGEGLTLRHEGRTDIPPLIAIRVFTVSGGLRELWNRHVDQVHLEGLEIMIPPRRGDDMPSLVSGVADGNGDDNVHINELVAENSLLTIMPKREGKGPRVFQIRGLRFDGFEFGKPIPFEAAITNPTPHGEIATVGAFGPWNAEAPSLTPIDGTFRFDADLGTIKGIGGALHAEGSFAGPLELIRTSGRTRTEGFHLSSGGAKFPLLVDYDAIVDGTNGDTILERIDARLGTSRISASGAVVKVEGAKGRRITLDTKTRGGRLEDFVKLATRVRSSPLTGTVDVTARLDIPPGEADVGDRMEVAGTFHVAKAQFTSQTIQDRVDELSRRGVGRPKDETIDDVASNFRGSFRLDNGRLHLRPLTFEVDGATVRLTGHYDTASERLDFEGELRLQAKASQTQTGWKRFVLKIFDPLLDGPGAGTVLPISITGPRDQPKFSADIKKAILK
ncbi:MAG TPA: AsmA-like C-terminal region-containing protein [Vicinamibacterales bacterium]|nr:AsmA-like C-terminal region-containing protein [Vicinamibacterales bacterium]